MVKINEQSDLHLEFDKRNKYVPTFLGEDVLILAGDIQVGLEDTMYPWFADLLETREVIYVLGNHEFYNQDFYDILNGLPFFEARVNELAEKRGFTHKLHCLQNGVYETDDAKFIAATMWTDFGKDNPLVKLAGIQGMNDFRIISVGKDVLTPAVVMAEHQTSRKFVEDELAKPTNKKKIVITHHQPSYQSVHEQYRNKRDELFNYLYYSDLDELVAKTDAWFAGHTHVSLDYKIENARVICNPRGYNSPSYLNKDFKDQLIEI